MGSAFLSASGIASESQYAAHRPTPSITLVDLGIFPATEWWAVHSCLLSGIASESQYAVHPTDAHGYVGGLGHFSRHSVVGSAFSSASETASESQYV